MRITKQPDVRKQELLDIGIAFYFEIGEKQISIQQIVKKANVATGLFYYYFKSKDQFLDEAMNYYVEKEFSKLEAILNDPYLSTKIKLDRLLEKYFEYAMQMAPYRNNDVFKTQRHYELTERLIKKLTPQVIELLSRGNMDKEFNIKNVELTAIFLLHAISCIFDENMKVNESTLEEMKFLIKNVLEK